MEIRLSRVGLRRGVSIDPGEDPLAELFRISSIHVRAGSNQQAWAKQGDYVSLFWRAFNPFEKWMFRNSNADRRQMLFVTVLTESDRLPRRLRNDTLESQALYTYIR